MSSRHLVALVLSLLITSIIPTLNTLVVESDPVTIIVPDDYPSIQEAIDNANNGDTVFVRNGTYYEHIVVDRTLSLVGEDRKTTTIDGGGEGPVVHVQTDNTVVSGFTIQEGGVNWDGAYLSCGILLDHSTNCSVLGNDVVNNYYGIISWHSFDSLINDNYLYDHLGGIIVYRSPHTLISNNQVNNSYHFQNIWIHYSSITIVYGNKIVDGRSGLWITCSHEVSVFCNDFIDNRNYGIYLYNLTRNLVHENNITRNGRGIEFWNASENIIYHNNFVNSTYGHVFDYAELMDEVNFSKNTWNKDYPIGGNYWSDYNGSDIFQGPFQNITGNDGIGDIQYSVYVNNTDHYPLMNPYRSTHAIAAGNVRLERWALGQGITTEVYVDIMNYGLFTETLNLTLLANETIIDQREITLDSIQVETIIINWDTTGFTKGNYTIKAMVSPVLGETDVSDNNASCWVIVSIVGDITGPEGYPDRKCDMRDVGVAGKAFGSYPGHERWNIEADITGSGGEPDNRVDMRDIGLIARHFGETDP
ncbi:MAG: NosD domain-containing protein [Candidatus Bathyarchaeota archaeon]